MKKLIRKKPVLLLLSAMLFLLISATPTVASARSIPLSYGGYLDVTYSGGTVYLHYRGINYSDRFDMSMTGIDSKILRYNPNVQSNDVKVLQWLLYATSCGTVGPSRDGYFGSETLQYVIRFQQESGLIDDGVAGPSTLNTLVSQLAN